MQGEDSESDVEDDLDPNASMGSSDDEEVQR